MIYAREDNGLFKVRYARGWNVKEVFVRNRSK